MTSTAQYDQALDHLNAALSLAEEGDDQDAQARVCRLFGRVYELRGEYQLALEWIARGLDILAGRPTPDAVEALVTAGLIHVRKGEYAEALARAREGFRLAEEIGDARVAARALGLQAIVYSRQGNSTQALTYAQQSLDRYTRAGNIHGQGLLHTELGNIFFVRGQWAESLHHRRQASEIFDQIGDKYYYAFASNNLGTLSRHQGRLDEALDSFQQGLHSLQQIGGSPYVIGVFQMNLGSTYIRMGQGEAALHHLRASRDLFARAEARDFLPELCYLSAEAALLVGNLVAATVDVEAALNLARELSQRSEEGNSLRVLGQLAIAQGDAESAERHLIESAEILHALDERYDEGRSDLWLARVFLSLGKTEQAHGALEQAIAIFEPLGAALDLKAARSLRDELHELTALPATAPPA